MEICPKSMNIWSRGVLGPLRVVFRFKDRSGTLSGNSRKPLFDLSGGNNVPKGDFLEIPKIGTGTKIDQWRQDRHRDPLKTLSGSGFEKHEKSLNF
jgi:hypothetical protein